MSSSPAVQKYFDTVLATFNEPERALAKVLLSHIESKSLYLKMTLDSIEDKLKQLIEAQNKREAKREKTFNDFRPTMTRDEFKQCIQDYVDEKCRISGNVLTRNQFAGVFAYSAKRHGFQVATLIKELIEADKLIVLIHKEPKPGQVTQYYTTENCLMTVPAIKLIVRDSNLMELRDHISHGKQVEKAEVAKMMAQSEALDKVRERSLAQIKEPKFLPDGTPDLSHLITEA